MTTTRQYDLLNRLQSVSSSPSSSSSSAIAFGYLYNDANQRTRRTEADGSYWVYQYDALGQVISGRKYWADGAPVPGQQFEYGFDDIGNRTTAKWGGDAGGSSASLRSATYTPTPTNTYSSRTVPGGFDVVGLANNAASVTVNSSPADYRRGEYFQEAVSVSNGSVPVWQQISVTATNSGSSSNWPGGYVFVPKTAENFTYDQDGNLTSDGRWTNKWDGENRLVEMVSLTNSPANSKLWLKFTYDWQGRRIAKQTSLWTNSAWSVVLSNRFLYDGWNLVAELNATNNAVIRRYQWGLDLSGSEQGAGGVGGLLSMYYVPTPSSCFVAYDGNGNVAGLVDVMTGTVAANYEYGPFGEAIRMSGSMAKANPFRFSTKYQDEETDLLYYGYRYYAPSLGRWLSRDQISELGGLSLYAFANNAPVDSVDVLGRWMWTVHLKATLGWSAQFFRPSYAIAIAVDDDKVDEGKDSPYPRPWGDMSKHLRRLKEGRDSREWWYERETGYGLERPDPQSALGLLQQVDESGDVWKCHLAASAFGRGLHSLQDISAHRPHPERPNDWPALVAHPAWWDDWEGINENKGAILYENLFHYWGRINQPPNYSPWSWRSDQFESQFLAKRQVEIDSMDALAWFAQKVFETCVCRKEMLWYP